MSAVSAVLGGDAMQADGERRGSVGGRGAGEVHRSEGGGAVEEGDRAGACDDGRREGYGLREERWIERRREDNVGDGDVDGAGCAGEVVGITYVDRADGVGAGGQDGGGVCSHAIVQRPWSEQRGAVIEVDRLGVGGGVVLIGGIGWRRTDGVGVERRRKYERLAGERS